MVDRVITKFTEEWREEIMRLAVERARSGRFEWVCMTPDDVIRHWNIRGWKDRELW